MRQELHFAEYHPDRAGQKRRGAHTGHLPIPERLWAAAGELAREHRVFPTAKALHLEYGKLKQRVEAAGSVASHRSFNNVLQLADISHWYFIFTLRRACSQDQFSLLLLVFR
jgi:hypothetical protein